MISGLHMKGWGADEKKTLSLVDGHQLCGLAQDLLGCLAFRSLDRLAWFGRCKDTTFPRTNKLFSSFFILGIVFCLSNTLK